MLPDVTSPDFPSALKRAREQKGLTRSQLARAAGIHSVMPRRYEEPDCREFTRPKADTVAALNRVLFGAASTRDAQQKPACGPVQLGEASVDEIVAELRQRGITVTLSFPAQPS